MKNNYYSNKTIIEDWGWSKFEHSIPDDFYKSKNYKYKGAVMLNEDDIRYIENIIEEYNIKIDSKKYNL